MLHLPGLTREVHRIKIALMKAQLVVHVQGDHFTANCEISRLQI